MDGTYNLADIAAVTRGNEGMFGGEGGFFWIFALLLLPMLTGGGGWFGNGREAVATNADVQRGFDQQTTTSKLDQLAYGISNLGYETLNNFNALERQMSECCCTTQRAIDSVNYNGAMNTAAINANTTAGIQKVLDAICGNRMADMQNQINALQLQAALCGVVKYPTATTYGAVNPFFGFGCGCNNNI